MTPLSEPFTEQLRLQVLLRTLPPPHERRSLRVRAGLSLHDVAVELGVTASAIQHWETKGNPTKQNIANYSALLDRLTRELS